MSEPMSGPASLSSSTLDPQPTSRNVTSAHNFIKECAYPNNMHAGNQSRSVGWRRKCGIVFISLENRMKVRRRMVPFSLTFEEDDEEQARRNV